MADKVIGTVVVSPDYNLFEENDQRDERYKNELLQGVKGKTAQKPESPGSNSPPAKPL